MSVQDAADLYNGITLVLATVGRVQVLDDFAEVLSHPLKLGIQSLGEAVNSFTFSIRWRDIGQRGFQRFQKLLELRLLAFYKIELML